MCRLLVRALLVPRHGTSCGCGRLVTTLRRRRRVGVVTVVTSVQPREASIVLLGVIVARRYMTAVPGLLARSGGLLLQEPRLLGVEVDEPLQPVLLHCHQRLSAATRSGRGCGC